MSTSVSQTYRLNKRTHDLLVEQARKEKRSVNYVVNQILARYVGTMRLSHLRVIRMVSRPQMTTLLDFVSDEDIMKAGSRIGISDPKDFLSLFGLEPDAGAFGPTLESLSHNASWFDFQTIPSADGVTYHLSNDLGWKWSKFLEGYLESLAKVLKIQIQTEATEFRIIVKVRNRTPKKGTAISSK